MSEQTAPPPEGPEGVEGKIPGPPETPEEELEKEARREASLKEPEFVVPTKTLDVVPDISAIPETSQGKTSESSSPIVNGMGAVSRARKVFDDKGAELSEIERADQDSQTEKNNETK